ncbi:hypothetical protein C1H46_042624 [Malus baccata]|uniref:AB hydrolase-1 domain-containing protein n=1 Tax=Malus baccata TaxID=106549 RepID=A0A540KD06_MALBA|nr:hypothetical protein C1H46_042624 [Malus baccata]
MSSSSPNPDASKKHFALIAGASHGARCWYKLSALLTSAGYDVTALGLAACGVHPEERWTVNENPPNEVQVINGTEHIVMFSKPQEFFSYLQAIAEN